MTQAANLGFPRIGARRELKQATEAYWKGSIDAPALLAVGAELRARHWKLQRDKGISIIPSNDFSFYDQMLDMTAALGAIPPRFLTDASAKPTHPNGSARGAMEEATRGAGHSELDRYFAMARGTKDAPAMEMTKWFDTNYHYIVPEFHQGQTFRLSSRKAVDEFNEAKALGIITRPVLIGPVTYLMLGKAKGEEFDPVSLLDALLPSMRSCSTVSSLRVPSGCSSTSPCCRLISRKPRSARCGLPTASLQHRHRRYCWPTISEKTATISRSQPIYPLPAITRTSCAGAVSSTGFSRRCRPIACCR
jgi:hypothetical protein